MVDGRGQPLAGARVVPDDPALAGRILYPAADLTSASPEGGTGASGLFLYVHSGGDAELVRLGVEGQPTYPAHHALGARGLALVLVLRPGAP